MTQSVKSLGGEAYDAGRKVYLFGLGAAAAALDGVRGTFERMVSRGEVAEKKVHDDRQHIVHKATDSAKELGRVVEEKVQEAVSGTLARAGVPSRSEIHDLIARVEALTAKVEALSQERRAAEEPGAGPGPKPV
jgi:poly(hydroxyalkanoate) granule-associated protein